MTDPKRSSRGGVWTLVGALGVVFGDIGTSPLYAMRTVLGEAGPVDPSTVLGVTLTVIWSLLLVVTMLYVGVLLGTDNEVARRGGMARWRQRLFLVIDRLATDRVDQLSLPRDRTIVIGREFDL